MCEMVAVNGDGRMYPTYFDSANSPVSPWLNAADCKPPAVLDDRSTSWITPLSRTFSSTPAHFPAAATSVYPPPQPSRYINRHSSPTSGLMSRCDVMESPLTSYGYMTSSLGNSHSRPILSSSSAGVDNALMSAALLHSAAAAEMNMMKNSPEHRTNTGAINDSTTTAAFRLRTKSHSSSGNYLFIYLFIYLSVSHHC